MYVLMTRYVHNRALTDAATKVGAIVGGQTSCKAPEVSALERHLPSDADIVCCHSLHAPAVDSKGQPLVKDPPMEGEHIADQARSSLPTVIAVIAQQRSRKPCPAFNQPSYILLLSVTIGSPQIHRQSHMLRF